MHYSNPTVVTFITTMQIVSAAKSLIPSFQAYSDDDKRYHLGLTWTDDKGLRDEHKLELRYTRNSEQLALKGEPQADGSWKHVEPNGNEHVLTSERANQFMKLTHKNAMVMNEMLTKLEKAGMQETIEAIANPV
mgnify:CR=1 FL=1